MRKLLILIVLVLITWFSYTAIAQGVTLGQIDVENFIYVQDQSKELDTRIGEIIEKTTVQYDEKKSTLNNAVKEYKAAKEEFQDLEEAQKQMAIESVDLFDIDFLWTIVGNYATEEKTLLQFDILESSIKRTESTSYIMCDLKFEVSGAYPDVTKFIYDLEDDDRLKFEISDFKMKKHEVEIPNSKNMTKEQIDAEKAKQENYVDATFTVKGIPLNSNGISKVATPEQDVGAAINEINAVISNQPQK